MTVIKENKKRFDAQASGQNSDTESLGLQSALTSDTESIHDSVNIRPRPFQALPFKPVLLEEHAPLKRSSGKRKMRRHENRLILQIQVDDVIDDNFIVLVDPYKSPFARLLEDTNAMKFWNSFIEKSEEEQTSMISAFSQKHKKHIADCAQNIEGRLGRISFRVKRTFKTKKNWSIEAVKDCELQLLDFFRSSPNNIYVKSPSTGFDRLLLKAIASYHGLQIQSAVEVDGTSKPQIKIFNDKENWMPANCFLTDFIQQFK